MNSDEEIKRLTSEVGEELRREATLERSTRILSLQETPTDSTQVWHIRLELTYDPKVTCDLVVEDDVIIGREQAVDITKIFPTIDVNELGVSRKHILLRPTANVLYVLDLGSTNGTRINMRLLGANIPHPIMNGDMVTLGRLEFIVRIVHMPKAPESNSMTSGHDPDTIMLSIIRAITTQLSLRDVLKQAIEMVHLYTNADEVSVWMVDEMSGELFLEASYGMKDQKVVHLPVENSLAGQALKLGKVQRTNRRADGAPIKLKTGYIAEGVIYVPLTLGDVQVGVISAVHREPGQSFKEADERIMVIVADLTAISIQNARLYQSTRQDLTRKSKVVSAFQYALSQEAKHHLHSVVGYATLLKSNERLDEDMHEMVSNISHAGEAMLDLVERLLSMARLSVEPIVKRSPCDLVEIMGNVVDSLHGNADAKSIAVQTRVEGKPFKIRGDAQYLFYSFYSLFDNAIKFTPDKGEINLEILFASDGITIRVKDNGSGIPEDELFDLFNRFFHSKPDDGSQGIGIGLEIVRTTVEAHMGTLTAQNRASGGAEFVIKLPASIRTEWPERTGNLQ